MSISLEEILSAQIRKAESLLLQVQSKGMLASRFSTDFSNYNRVSRDIEGWEIETVEYLNTYYGEDSKQCNNFQELFCKKVYQYSYGIKDFDENWNSLQEEIDRCISYLNVLIKTDKIKCRTHTHTGTDTKIATIKNQAPKLFISHSSFDSVIIKEFVEIILQLGLGLTPEDIAFTSEESFGVEPGENIAKYIRENITSASVVLVMISKNYKASEVCLNEMGAAWALGKKCISVVLPGADFKDLGWLTSLDKAVSITEKNQLAHLCTTLSGYLSINLSKRFTLATSKIDEFITEIGTIKQPVQAEKNEIVDNQAKMLIEQSGFLKLFDIVFKSVYLNEGEYIIQLNARLRSEKEQVSIKHVFLRNQTPFFGTTDNPRNEMEFKTYMPLGVFELNSDADMSYRFVIDDFNKTNHSLLDMVVEKDHTISMSFVQYFKTIRECDGCDELQLKGWSLVVQYNVNGEVSIPLILKPIDLNAQGKYWHN